MTILVGENTKVICQGFTGSPNAFHSGQAIACGTRMVGGVAPREEMHVGAPMILSAQG